MKKIKDKLFDILLYPSGLYSRLNDSKATLYAGIVLVGAIDLIHPDANIVYKPYFVGRPTNILYTNVLIGILLILLLGIIDVTFVSVPLFDFFKFIKKKELNLYDKLEKYGKVNGKEKEKLVLPVMNKEDREYTASRIKVMKAYIMSHFIIVPVTAAVYYAFLRHVTDISPVWMQYLALGISLLIFIWSAAVMARGINSLFRFTPVFKRFTFIIVFTWNYIFSAVFNEQIMNWLLRLFR